MCAGRALRDGSLDYNLVTFWHHNDSRQVYIKYNINLIFNFVLVTHQRSELTHLLLPVCSNPFKGLAASRIGIAPEQVYISGTQFG